jgi:hypothetical protein
MWTRRVLLATIVAAAALSVARTLPASGSSDGFAHQAMLVGAAQRF